MNKKIEDIKLAVTSKAYQSALSLTLTLPAICSEVQYGNSERTNYEKWCNDNIPNNAFEFGIDGFQDNEITGKILYQLRCSIVHAGTSDIINNPGVKLYDFSFWVNESSQPTYGYEYIIKTINGREIKCTKLDLLYLIDVLCKAAEDFYNTWPNKEDFDKHRIDIEIR